MNIITGLKTRQKTVGLLSLLLITGCAHSVYKRPAYKLPKVELPDYSEVSQRPSVFVDIKGYQRAPDNTNDDDPIDTDLTATAEQALARINRQHGFFETLTTDPFYREGNDLILKIRVFIPRDIQEGETLEWLPSFYSGGILTNDLIDLRLVEISLEDGQGNSLGTTIKIADAIVYTTSTGPLAGVHRDEDAAQGFSLIEHILRYGLKNLLDQKQLDYAETASETASAEEGEQ